MHKPDFPSIGKILNKTGIFTDLMVKPSFIPAETVNLILDNLGGLTASTRISLQKLQRGSSLRKPKPNRTR